MNLDILKSDFDNKEYRLITLENGLQALLVSDVKNQIDENDETTMSISEDGSDNELSIDGDDNETSDVEEEEEGDGKKAKLAACSLCVAAGSFYDPPNAQGLAHFLEHMLFMGSEKYPEENNFDEYVQSCGGYSNACTNYEYTLFHFECREKYLNQILDRFSQFFISPLLLKSSMAREREAINSEFELSVSEDDARLEQLIGSLAPTGHPARNFSWGNRESLEGKISDDELLQTLRNFWLSYYSAERIKLTVVSRFSLDVLEKYVREHFSPVAKTSLPRLDLSPFSNVNWGPDFNSIVFIKPIKEMYEVCLTWILPPLNDYYEAGPLLYINFFLAHEAKGSILHYLKEKVWALGLTSGEAEPDEEANSLYTKFVMTIQLTSEGYDALDKILNVVFGYLALLRKSLPDKRTFDEYLAICLADFRNKDDVDPGDFAKDLSSSMHIHKPKHFISARHYCHEYRPDVISNVIQKFGVDNFNVAVRVSSVPDSMYNREEQWCRTKYAVTEITEEMKKKWMEAEPFSYCSLPAPTPYATKNFDIYPCEKISRYPEKIMKTPLLELWYRQDAKFKRPTAVIAVFMTSPIILSIKNRVLKDLFVKYFNTILSGAYYDATLANYNWEFTSGDLGIHFKFHGYNEKLQLLMSQIMLDVKTKMVDFLNDDKNSFFTAMKQDLERKYVNYLKETEEFVRSFRLVCLEETGWTYFEKLQALSTVTLADLVDFYVKFFANFNARMLIQGNLTEEMAKDIGNEFLNGFAEPVDPAPRTRVWKLQPGKEKKLRINTTNPENNQGTVVNYFQFGPFEMRPSCIIDLITYIMSEPLFDTLRTKQQLGYEVFCEATNTSEILGFTVNVCHQRKFTVDDVDQRIDEFLKEFAATLRSFPPRKFENFKETLCALKKVDDNSLLEEASRNYTEIVSQQYTFDRLLIEVTVIDLLTQNEVCEFFEQMAVNPETRKKFSVQALPAQEDITNNPDPNTVECRIECPDKELFVIGIEELREVREFYDLPVIQW